MKSTKEKFWLNWGGTEVDRRTIRVQARQRGVTGYVNIMRPGIFGNHFPLSVYSRKESLKLYEISLREKLRKDSDFAARFDNLVGKQLGCVCRLDQNCHGDVIIRLLHERIRLRNDKLRRKRLIL